MNQRHLREDRRHGIPQFPVATYRMVREAFDPILDNHWHDEAEFLWVESGMAVFQIGLSTYELHAGEGIFIPCSEVHGGYALLNSSCTYIAVVFHMDWLTESKDGISTKYLQPLRRGDAVIPSVYSRATKWGQLVLGHLSNIHQLFESDDLSKEMRIKAELYLLFADLLSYEHWTRRNPAHPVDSQTMERMKSVILYIESHCGLALTVPQLASVAGMSIGHFSRVFKVYMRKTPMEYVNQYRIQQAAFLLENKNMSIADVALEIGMSNFSYFCKRFRKIYDCTPSQYRKN